MIDCSKCLDRGSCCGPIPISKEIIEKHRDKFQVDKFKEFETEKGITILTDDLGCIFLDRKTKLCVIYEDRPTVCKLYGTTKDIKLACPYFKPNGNSRSEGKRKQIERWIKKQWDQISRDLVKKSNLKNLGK